MQTALTLPDPLLTASLFCAGHLDELIADAVVDAWRELETMDEQAFLWMMRYPRGGEHLKLRIHGRHAGSVEAVRPILERSARSFFADQKKRIERGEFQREERRDVAAPPIDVEDEPDGLRDDHELIWSQFRRSPVSLGGPPFTDRDEFVALFARCLGASCAWYLEQVADHGTLAPASRHLLFSEIVLSGLEGLGLEGDRQADFLLYYRDWQARTPMRRIGASQEKADAWLAKTHRDLASRSERLDAIRSLVDRRSRAGRARGPRESAWIRSLHDLAADIETFRGDERYEVDPFAVDMLFAPVLKVFTGTANQLGFGQMEEVKAVQLLLMTLFGERALCPIALTI